MQRELLPPYCQLTSQHQVPAKRFMSRTQANPNRWYYACARDREDPKRCKFFKWEDELDKSKGNVLGGASPAKGQTLGAAPGTPSRLMRPTPGSATPRKIGLQSSAAGSTTPSKSGSRTPSDILKAVSAGSAGISTPSAKRLRRWNEPKDDIVSVPDSEEEGSSDIDWGSVDTDKLEEEARSQTNTPRAVRYDNAPVTDTKKRKLSTLAEDDGVSLPFPSHLANTRTLFLSLGTHERRQRHASDSSAASPPPRLQRRRSPQRHQAGRHRRIPL